MIHHCGRLHQQHRAAAGRLRWSTQHLGGAVVNEQFVARHHKLPRAAAGGTATLTAVELAVIAAQPVLKVSLLCGAGALCAKQGILTLQSRRMLSGLIMNLFTPALLFSKLGASVDARQALELWPLAANMVALHAVGLGLGWAQVSLLNVPRDLRPQMLVMPALGNVGNLPLVLVPTLLSSPEVAAMSGGTQGQGLTLVMLGFFTASLIQFPIGYIVLSKPPDAPAAAAVAAAATAAAAAAVPAAADPLPAGIDGTALAVAAAPTAEQPLQKQQQQQSTWSAVVKGVWTPPVIACVAAIPVGTIPALRDALGPEGSLSVLGDAIGLLGSPLIPCLFLVLGANLAEGPGAAKVPPRYLVSMIVTKLLVAPAVGLGCVWSALHGHLLPPGTPPLVPLVMMLVWTSPTAVLVHSLATLLQNGEDQVSAFLFWQYLASLVTLPAFLSLYLALLQAGQLAA